MSVAAATLGSRQWQQIGLLTAGALGIFFLVRALPTGTNLSHMDFRVDGRNSIEFCDPANPQFIPVVAVASPVAMRLLPHAPVVAAHPAEFTLSLTTAQGKPIAPTDLLLAHTKLLHLLITDPSLQDYQHVHPEPGKRAGEWTFSFTPRFSGNYRLFADFTPVATARGLYANSDLEVLPTASAFQDVPPSAAVATETWRAEQSGYTFRLHPSSLPVRRGQPLDLAFTVARADGGNVGMEPVMGAFAHLVAFDESRSGFAHLHPLEIDLLKAPDAKNPRLNFKIRIPRAGRYVIWSQVKISGQEIFAPFWFRVVE